MSLLAEAEPTWFLIILAVFLAAITVMVLVVALVIWRERSQGL